MLTLQAWGPNSSTRIHVNMLDMLVCACNPCAEKAEISDSLGLTIKTDQPSIISAFQANGGTCHKGGRWYSWGWHSSLSSGLQVCSTYLLTSPTPRYKTSTLKESVGHILKKSIHGSHLEGSREYEQILGLYVFFFKCLLGSTRLKNYWIRQSQFSVKNKITW